MSIGTLDLFARSLSFAVEYSAFFSGRLHFQLIIVGGVGDLEPLLPLFFKQLRWTVHLFQLLSFFVILFFSLCTPTHIVSISSLKWKWCLTCVMEVLRTCILMFLLSKESMPRVPTPTPLIHSTQLRRPPPLALVCARLGSKSIGNENRGTYGPLKGIRLHRTLSLSEMLIPSLKKVSANS